MNTKPAFRELLPTGGRGWTERSEGSPGRARRALDSLGSVLRAHRGFTPCGRSNPGHPAGHPSPIRRGLFALAMAAGLLVVPGCGSYARVSPAAFELAKVLNTVCNLEDAQQLPRFRELADARLESGQITDAEHALLMDIADEAAAGDWDDAELEARQLLKDQNERR